MFIRKFLIFICILTGLSAYISTHGSQETPWISVMVIEDKTENEHYSTVYPRIFESLKKIKEQYNQEHQNNLEMLFTELEKGQDIAPVLISSALRSFIIIVSGKSAQEQLSVIVQDFPDNLFIYLGPGECKTRDNLACMEMDTRKADDIIRKISSQIAGRGLDVSSNLAEDILEKKNCIRIEFGHALILGDIFLSAARGLYIPENYRFEDILARSKAKITPETLKILQDKDIALIESLGIHFDSD